MNLPSIRRVLVAVVVSVLSLVAAAPAAAVPPSSTHTIGPIDLNDQVMPFGTDDETFINQTLPLGSQPSIGDAGRVTTWRANVLTAGPIRLAVVHPTGSPGEFTVTGTDDQVAAQAGVNEFTPESPLPIAAGDTIALIQVPGGAVPRYSNNPGTTFWVKSGAITPMSPATGETFTAPVAPAGAVLFNADVDTSPAAPSTPEIEGDGAFPDTTVGQASATRTFEVQSVSKTDVVVGHHGVEVLGDKADFDVVSDACSGHTIQPKDSCPVTIRFKPGSPGTKLAKLRVTSNALEQATAPLSGTAKAAAVVVNPPKVDPKPPIPAKPAPTLTAIVGPNGNGSTGTGSSAAITVKRNSVGVGCTVTGTVLTSCRVELYANAPNGKGARAARLVHVGTGTYVNRAGSQKLEVKVVLNATGRKLLTQSPGGLRVRVKITGTPVSGDKLEATGAARLVPRSIAATIGGFDVDGFGLSRAAKRRLRTLAKQIGTAKTVRCVGHTDGSSDDSSYLGKLGQKRAKKVCAQLARYGVKARFVTGSKGAAAPRATNRTKSGRAANRRVELRVAR